MIDAEYEISRAREDFNNSWKVKPYSFHYEKYIKDLETTIRMIAKERDEENETHRRPV